MSPHKECYIYFIIPNVPFLQQISPPWDSAVWHSKLSPGKFTRLLEISMRYNNIFYCTWAEGSSALLWSYVFRRPSVVNFHIFDFPTETTEQNSTKLDRKQDLNVLYQCCVFQVGWKTRWPPWALIGADIFLRFPSTAEENLAKLERKQDLNVPYKVCVFGLIVTPRWPPRPLIGYFQLLLWNHWTEFEEAWQEARSQGNLVFFGLIGETRWPPGLWLAETFSTTPPKPLNGIRWHLTGRKISTSSIESVFYGLIGKPRWPPWHLIRGDTFSVTLDYIVAQQTQSIHWLINK